MTWIVIVEDNKADVVLLRQALDEQGLSFHADVLADGEEAIAFIRRVPASDPSPCLIILDLNLPKRDGLEVLSVIRGSKHWNLATVVVLTTSDSPIEREAAEKIGVQAYLRKPVDLDSFMALGVILKQFCAEGESASGRISESL